MLKWGNVLWGHSGSPVCHRFDFFSPLSSYSVLTSLFPPMPTTTLFNFLFPAVVL